MASGDREKPQCRVCKTVFTFKGPEPLLLPCLHPACKSCVDSTEENITCTSCQELFRKANYVFPKHFILSKDILKLTLKQNPSIILCTFRHDGAVAETWCPKCEAFLCNTCKEFHKDIQSTRSHVVESQQNCLDLENYGVKRYCYCTTHQEYPLEVFDSSCGRLLCYKCLIQDHSTCKVEDIIVAFDKMKDSELDNNIEQIVSRLDSITELEQEAQDIAKQLEENYKRVKDEVINTFSDVRATLDMREKILLQETNESLKEVENVHKKRIEVLKQEKMRCETALRFMKRSKEISDPVQALTMKKTVDERTAACTDVDLMKIDELDFSISLSTKDLSDMKKSIESFARVYSVLGENTTVNPGLTTREIQNKKILKLKEELEECHKTLHDIQVLSEQSHKQGKIELEIPGMSGMKYPCEIHSETKNIRNMPWKLCAMVTLQNDAIVLGLYLLGDYQENSWEEWSCDVTVAFELTSNSFRQDRKQYLSHTIKERHSYGFNALRPMNTLLNPTMGYVQDDCIRVSVEVDILKTTGVPRFEELVEKICKETLVQMYSPHTDSDSEDGDGNDEEYSDTDEEECFIDC